MWLANVSHEEARNISLTERGRVTSIPVGKDAQFIAQCRNGIGSPPVLEQHEVLRLLNVFLAQVAS